MQKGKDTYGYELFEQRYGLERGDMAARRVKYRQHCPYLCPRPNPCPVCARYCFSAESRLHYAL